ncbi:endonuclease domain-containing protein [Sphingomonas sp. GB1N7]|uniref:endonuclease domain-containing protein n=1 Tax=Parasphingomonas caseinilytica TaxID=3096158 RepID=UPI002FC63492
MPRISPVMKQRARDLRKHRTDAEALIWRRLHDYRPRFTTQLSIGSYIIDLACRRVKLAVEFDGSQHVDSEYDLERTTWLEGLGWTVLRFWNLDAMTNPDGVAEAIIAKVGELVGPTQPLPSREGRRARVPRTRST